MPKVTRKGGGSALPWRRRLFGRIVHAAVEAARPAGVPVTVKMRKGIDDDHLTYVEAGLIAQEAGVVAVALHARTAAQRYSGSADWEAIATLKQALDVPVLGNGDIWEAEDALAMVRATGCDGIVVGRGCLGRPWLFADLLAAFEGRSDRLMPTLGEVARVMRRHAELLTDWLGTERDGCTDLRKHVAWYLKGFPVGSGTSSGPGHGLVTVRTGRPAGKTGCRRAVSGRGAGTAPRAYQLAWPGPPPRRMAGEPGRRRRA